MKKNIDLNRLGMVIRWDVLNNWTHNLGVIVGLAICFSITNIIRLYKISGFIAASHELDAMTDSYKKSAYMFFGFISFMVIYERTGPTTPQRSMADRHCLRWQA